MKLQQLEQHLDDSSLPSLPAILTQLIAILDEPEINISELCLLVSADIALSARVLSVVNSAWYSLPQPVESIHQAVSLIGLRELRALVAGAKVAEMFRKVPSELIDMHRMWQNTYVSACLAGEMGGLHKLGNSKLYTIGLLHHVGLMAMLQCMPEQMAGLILSAKGNEQELYLKEKRLLGYTHADVSAMMMRRWGLPEVFADVCTYHHEFYRATRHTRESAIIYLADDLAQLISPIMNIQMFTQNPDLAIYDYLSMTPERIESYVQRGQAHKEMASMLY